MVQQLSNRNDHPIKRWNRRKNANRKKIIDNFLIIVQARTFWTIKCLPKRTISSGFPRWINFDSTFIPLFFSFPFSLSPSIPIIFLPYCFYWPFVVVQCLLSIANQRTNLLKNYYPTIVVFPVFSLTNFFINIFFFHLIFCQFHSIRFVDWLAGGLVHSLVDLRKTKSIFSVDFISNIFPQWIELET